MKKEKTAAPKHPPIGSKFDQGKIRLHLLPWRGVLKVVKVLEYGTRKYSEGNWRHVQGFEKTYWNSAMRHMVAYGLGEENDSESGLPHIAHAACCLLFMLDGPYKPNAEDVQKKGVRGPNSSPVLSGAISSAMSVGVGAVAAAIANHMGKNAIAPRAKAKR